MLIFNANVNISNSKYTVGAKNILFFPTPKLMKFLICPLLLIKYSKSYHENPNLQNLSFSISHLNLRIHSEWIVGNLHPISSNSPKNEDKPHRTLHIASATTALNEHENGTDEQMKFCIET